ncbi:lasso RiPP family leader peptide-containing protein [Nonomuraea sp. NPDC003560]
MEHAIVQNDLYEPPALAEAGDFSDLTMGPRAEGNMDGYDDYYRG